MKIIERIEIQATEHSKVYAKVEGRLFSVGHISDLREMFPDREPKDCEPFFVEPCKNEDNPSALYEIYSRRLVAYKEWILGNEVLGLDDKPYSVPTCPNCKEITYSMPECPFCGQMLKDPVPEQDWPKAYNHPCDIKF